MTGARRIGEAALGIVPIAAILLLWHALAVSGATPAAILPTPGTVFARLLQQLGTPQYWDTVYDWHGVQHHMQTTAAPGTTVTVNANGEPRAAQAQ